MVFNLNNGIELHNGLIFGARWKVFCRPILPQAHAAIFSAAGHVSIRVAKAASAAGFGIGIVRRSETFAYMPGAFHGRSIDIHTSYDYAFRQYSS